MAGQSLPQHPAGPRARGWLATSSSSKPAAASDGAFAGLGSASLEAQCFQITPGTKLIGCFKARERAPLTTILLEAKPEGSDGKVSCAKAQQDPSNSVRLLLGEALRG